MSDVNTIDDRLIALGRWIGLVKGSEEDPQINLQWLDDPISQIENAPSA